MSIGFQTSTSVQPRANPLAKFVAGASNFASTVLEFLICGPGLVGDALREGVRAVPSVGLGDRGPLQRAHGGGD